ncbi:hypothetical protein G7046_g9749 [Stylonectria norvegica]|nr:hypothetical protein G7046_g9749 [Stylonectria norvegica]
MYGGRWQSRARANVPVLGPILQTCARPFASERATARQRGTRVRGSRRRADVRAPIRTGTGTAVVVLVLALVLPSDLLASWLWLLNLPPGPARLRTRHSRLSTRRGSQSRSRALMELSARHQDLTSMSPRTRPPVSTGTWLPALQRQQGLFLKLATWSGDRARRSPRLTTPQDAPKRPNGCPRSKPNHGAAHIQRHWPGKAIVVVAGWACLAWYVRTAYFALYHLPPTLSSSNGMPNPSIRGWQSSQLTARRGGNASRCIVLQGAVPNCTALGVRSRAISASSCAAEPPAPTVDHSGELPWNRVSSIDFTPPRNRRGRGAAGTWSRAFNVPLSRGTCRPGDTLAAVEWVKWDELGVRTRSHLTTTCEIWSRHAFIVLDTILDDTIILVSTNKPPTQPLPNFSQINLDCRQRPEWNGAQGTDATFCCRDMVPGLAIEFINSPTQGRLLIMA